MADGSADLAGVLSMRNDPALGAIHLLSVLEAVPGALKVLTRRRLAELGWDENLPIAALTDEEVADAVREFATPVARPVEA
jgi:hypothetical protein